MFEPQLESYKATNAVTSGISGTKPLTKLDQFPKIPLTVYINQSFKVCKIVSPIYAGAIA